MNNINEKTIRYAKHQIKFFKTIKINLKIKSAKDLDFDSIV